MRRGKGCRKCKTKLANINNTDPVGNAHFKAVHWLSGRVLDSRPRGRGFERHCIVVLEQDTFILA